jgi:hypothetical protein
MDPTDLAGFCRAPERLGGDVKKLGGFVQLQPGFNPVFGRLMHWDALMRAQRRHPFAGPAIAIARDEAIPVKDAGNEVVIGNQYKLADRGDHVGRGAVALAAPTSGQAYLAVDAADPMNNKHDLRRHLVDIGDHLMDDGAHDALLQPRIR